MCFQSYFMLSAHDKYVNERGDDDEYMMLL